MSNLDTLRNNIVNAFYDNSVLLNVALNIEKFLQEDAIIYPYKGWEEGELISGPFIKRYFVSIILRFAYEDMPDPEGAKVLKEFGIAVKYKKVKEKEIDEEETEKQNKEVTKSVNFWYVQLDIPHALVTDERQAEQLKDIEDMIDIEAIENVADETDNGTNFGDFDTNNDFGGDDFGGPTPDFGGPEVNEPAPQETDNETK